MQIFIDEFGIHTIRSQIASAHNLIWEKLALLDNNSQPLEK
jgi:hypothetical protein